MDSGVEFIAVGNSHANKLTLHILAAVAEHEREMISERTRAALARGVKLGRNGSEHLARLCRASAVQHAMDIAPILMELKERGLFRSPDRR